MGEGAGPGLVGVALLGQKKSPVGQKRIGKKESGHLLLLPARRTHEWVPAIGSWGSV
jgi:hypothetical protein